MNVVCVWMMIPHATMHATSKEGRPYDWEEVGEVMIRGPCVFEGYWTGPPPAPFGRLHPALGALQYRHHYSEPILDRSVFTHDGWFRTGDAAVIDPNGEEGARRCGYY